MPHSKSSPLVPVDGIVIDRPMGKTFGLAALASLFFSFGAFLIWAKVSQKLNGLHEGQRGITLWGLAVGICAVVSSPFMVAYLLRSWWVKNRLVIALDRLQIVERLGGKDVVMLQIPFANIASVKYDATEGRLGIDLKDLDDPGTYVGSFLDFKLSMAHFGRHFCITYGYRGGPAAITAEIEEEMKRWSGTT